MNYDRCGICGMKEGCPCFDFPLWVMEKLTQAACWLLWNLSEFSGIGLGRLAPHVFGGMIGRKGRRQQ